MRATQALWGQEIGLKPIGDQLWAVYFEGLNLGEFDERKRMNRAVSAPAKRRAKELLRMRPTEPSNSALRLYVPGWRSRYCSLRCAPP